jgi:hypothetical protein
MEVPLKTLSIVTLACLLAACQGNKAATDQPPKNKVQRDADRDRKTQDVQEQLRTIAH